MKYDIHKIKTLGELKAAGYNSISVKEEVRRNLVGKLNHNEGSFPGILGYDETVIPDIHRAILSKHNILLLGLRGQAKTKLARLFTTLLDEYIPVIADSEINDDPFDPVSKYGIDKVNELGDSTPVAWIHRDERFIEKLATPDVSVADLIGDADPIKAANLRLPYSDERVIHFGLIPRSNRSVFVINELPDLQPRIQVALFNILQEGDIQVRGFRLRIPLDILFIFTANPEDYTNRGSIVTPLKDRIESQILTHYPKTIDISKMITAQESQLSEEQKNISVDPVCFDLVEQIAIEARSSEYVDQKSGVSARLTISAFENLVSSAELRALKNKEKTSFVRMSDFPSVIPSITGKIELVYEGEQEGPVIVAQNLLGKAIRTTFANYFPAPEQKKKGTGTNPYQEIVQWFNSGKTVDILSNLSEKEYAKILNSVPGLKALVTKFHPEADAQRTLFLMEFILHGLAEFSLIGKNKLEQGTGFRDILSGMLSQGAQEDAYDDEEWEEDEDEKNFG